MNENDRTLHHPNDVTRKMSEVGEDSALVQALENFRLSVHAWSEAVYSNPRSIGAPASHRRTWKLAVTWALGCVLAAGLAAGGFEERQHRIEMAKIAAQRDAERQRQMAEERAREAEDLLAKVDSDVSREVPNAMEPLAQLMAEDESR
jgi:hypothetical protein